MILEVCIDSVASAVAAERGGAARVELCDNLVEGGTTPSLGMIETVRAAVRLGLMVMIRPRGGDFVYSVSELEVMRRDIRAARSAGADGVVLGLLTRTGEVDLDRTGSLVEEADPLPVTFHRAFDMVRDQEAALEGLVAAGVRRILTSGGRDSAYDGRLRIGELVRRSAGRVVILPGGGINLENAGEVVRDTGAGEIHVGGPLTASGESFGDPLAGFARVPSVVDEGKVAALLASLERHP